MITETQIVILRCLPFLYGIGFVIAYYLSEVYLNKLRSER